MRFRYVESYRAFGARTHVRRWHRALDVAGDDTKSAGQRTYGYVVVRRRPVGIMHERNTFQKFRRVPNSMDGRRRTSPPSGAVVVSGEIR